MDCIDENKEVEIFIAKHNIMPTHEEKLILKLAILHGAITYNEWRLKKYRRNNG